MKIAFDTNVLVYAEGYGDIRRTTAAGDLVRGLLGRMVLPAQVLGELYNVLLRKGGLTRPDVLERIETWRQSAEVVGTQASSMIRALQLATDHQLQIWDAVVVVAAIEAGATLLLSEDFHHGFLWNGLTVVNPFETPLHPLLAAALVPRS